MIQVAERAGDVFARVQYAVVSRSWVCVWKNESDRVGSQSAERLGGTR